jgi:hypothetical protein
VSIFDRKKGKPTKKDASIIRFVLSGENLTTEPVSGAKALPIPTVPLTAISGANNAAGGRDKTIIGSTITIDI